MATKTAEAGETTHTPEASPSATPVAAFDEGRFFLELQSHMDRSFSSFKREIHDDIRSTMARHADASFKEHEKTRRHVAAMTTKVDKMWHKVYGEGPPSGGPPSEDISFALTEPSASPQKTIPQQISEHDATLAGVQGQIIALDSNTNKALEAINVKVDALTDLQKKQMGMRDTDDRGAVRKLMDGVVWILTDRAGRKFALTLIAALSGLATSCGTFYALSTGRLPLPTQMSPQGGLQPSAPGPQPPPPGH